jgi:hypothetical protein
VRPDGMRIRSVRPPPPSVHKIKESLILNTSGFMPEVLSKVDLLKLCAAFILTHKGSGILPQSL